MTLKPSLILTALAAAVLVMFSANLAPQAQGTPPDAARKEARALAPGDVLTSEEVHFI